ncbi:dihydrodipicolinate synthase family protein [Rhodopirellula sp. SWK7]|uniref:dihydrodipicolinate synthase family protein n=1 Tax=Rhodopirellula sp. SWK7 TaxID=595460 RepID=UPI0005C6F2CE|nr:dihydrodipicolinate synthase family protein [Rhodopirellula sp. SWK7]
MRPLCADEITGNWATLQLSWTKDERLDLRRVETQVDRLIQYRVDGIYSSGTAGEFHCQTEAEFDEVSEMLAERCNAVNMNFQIGVSHMSPQISLERLRRVVPLKPSAVQVILPDWFPSSEFETITFLKRMAEEAQGIGIVLYNPPHAKRVLRPIQVATIAKQIPKLVGLKSAGGDANWFREMREHLQSISVFIPGHHLATGMREGAQGAYSNVACLNPLGAQRWSDLIRSDLQAGLDIEKRLQAFFAKHITPYIRDMKYCNAACDRLLAHIGGWTDISPTLRWPYRSIPVGEAERLRPIAREQLPEFFE